MLFSVSSFTQCLSCTIEPLLFLCACWFQFCFGIFFAGARAVKQSGLSHAAAVDAGVRCSNVAARKSAGYPRSLPDLRGVLLGATRIYYGGSQRGAAEQ